MRTSTDRIFTTHTGSLPRPASLTDLGDADAVKAAVNEAVRRQREACRVPELRPYLLTCCFPDQPVAGGTRSTPSVPIARRRRRLAVQLRTIRWVRVSRCR